MISEGLEKGLTIFCRFYSVVWASLLDTAARGLELKPYLAKLETEMAAGKKRKLLNLIVPTDGVLFDAPLYQVWCEVLPSRQ